ncbi:hypothetical protein Q4E93_26375 [Flavitalea sp. BT771]|uniref:hypothetical protein n=1 Tax=Flavitalea sp. BT771 TaxID=3063329 RepID=UPI0026E11518|nr:hypothetical protein [Flavitalea sp. BT771]MDO6434163.1 hypothetical protein [Flavitalea sp. BT771]
MGFRMMVWNAIPSANSTNIEYPTYGSMEERNKCSILFNSYLKMECEKRNLVFLSVFKKLIKGNLKSRTVYFFDGIHLGQMAMPMVLREIYRVAPDLLKKHYPLYEILFKNVIARGKWLFMSVKQFLSFRQNVRSISRKITEAYRKG